MKTKTYVKTAAKTLLFLMAITGISAFVHVQIAGHQLGHPCVYAGNSNVPDWMTDSDDAEEKVGSMGEKVFKLFLVFAAAAGAVGFVWGLAEMNGFVGEADRGPGRIKKGLLTIAVATIAYPLVGFFASLAR